RPRLAGGGRGTARAGRGRDARPAARRRGRAELLDRTWCVSEPLRGAMLGRDRRDPAALARGAGAAVASGRGAAARGRGWGPPSRSCPPGGGGRRGREAADGGGAEDVGRVVEGQCDKAAGARVPVTDGAPRTPEVLPGAGAGDPPRGCAGRGEGAA